MPIRHPSILRIAFSTSFLLLAGGIAACDLTSSGSSSTSAALSSAVESATSASGVLLCAPQQGQLDACSGKAVGDSCTLTANDRHGSSIEGTCRDAIDGSGVACAPNPPPPPKPAVDACSGKAAGDTCTMPGREGRTENGVCGVARDGVTVACHPTFTPPQVALDACSGKAEGDACSFANRDGTGTLDGVCNYGRDNELSTLACAPNHRFPDAAVACASLAVGDSCTMTAGRGSATGTCTTVDSGVVCVVECGSLRGHFDCHGPEGHEGPGPDGGQLPPPPQGSTPPQ